ncbi:succinate dehydrogenase, cytochrome b556 subunit [Pseudoxanthomonas sp. CAU 1598]|uniref:Succinate dehydrogenase cytochrome b556 subunit n=1 Tax=Pseudomarimonas arenosa TaxID=2774145 RepID=A0AAW3ZJC7_9GAMM|nr:succinate dehydrogenase, cytochrome b556 subunit [Pseudomarimonas arenosa]
MDERDTPVSTSKHARPLSPHLQVYRWQITMVMSILHRATGVALAVGAFLVAAWLVAVAGGAESYAGFTALLNTLVGKVALAGFSACLIYHLLNGLRHLWWDMGHGYEIPKVYATGWTVWVLTIALTAGLWFVAFTGGAA